MSNGQCRRDVGKADKNYRGSRSDYDVYVFDFLGSTIICRLFKLTFSDQAQSFRFNVKIFSRPFFVDGPKQFIERYPKPLPAFLSMVS
jgi:hypothetical protein